MSRLPFTEQLRQRQTTANTLLCVGLDPDPRQRPELATAEGLAAFCRTVIDAAGPHVCAFKPQIAHFAALGQEAILAEAIAYMRRQFPQVPVILDAKRGDIGSTAEMYAREAFERYDADAVTLSPYLGHDTVEPFLQYRDRGCIFLCRTSNPGSGQFQGLLVEGEPLFLRLARIIAEQWNTAGNCGLVVGATYPQELAQVRAVAPTLPILLPGVGAQGGELESAVKLGRSADGLGLLVSSSRAIIYADRGPEPAAAIAGAAAAAQAQINAARQ